MPSVADVIEYTELLRVCPIALDEDRCVAVRNRNSQCRKCVDACITSAITVENNEITIDAAACVNCGACIAVCPNNVLSAIDPEFQQVLAQVSARAERKTGCAVIACARAASKHIADPEKFAEVPCLGHINESELTALCAQGLDDIVLVDGVCETCKYGKTSPLVDDAIACGADLIEAAGSGGIITRTSEFPPEVISHKKNNVRGESRRGLLAQTGRYVKTVAGGVAQKALGDTLGLKKDAPHTLKERLGAGKSGRMPTFEPTENYALIETMAQMAERTGEADDLTCSDERLDTRHFGDLSIDVTSCSGCGLCVMFCPTGAIKYAKYDKPEQDNLRYVEFQAADCTQCRLCEDVCMRHCLEIASEVKVCDLFDFEPKLVPMCKPKARSPLLFNHDSE